MTATTTVPHRGGSCLQIPRNRHKNVLDRIDDTCYRKTSKKRFPITSYFISKEDLPVEVRPTGEGAKETAHLEESGT